MHTDSIKIVTPSWIVDSIKEKKRQDETNYVPSKFTVTTETETTSSLLTPDDNDRTTATPLPAGVPQDTSVSTPVMAGSKLPIALPSALMSPVSPVVTTTATTAAEASVTMTTVQSRSSITVPEAEEKSIARDSASITSEKTGKLETKQETVAASGGIKIVENNNEEILGNEKENEKENKETTNEQDPEKSAENQGWKLRMSL